MIYYEQLHSPQSSLGGIVQLGLLPSILGMHFTAGQLLEQSDANDLAKQKIKISATNQKSPNSC